MLVKNWSFTVPQFFVCNIAIVRRLKGHLAIYAALFALVLIPAAGSVYAAGYETGLPVLEFQSGPPSRQDILAPSEISAPMREIPHLVPYGDPEEPGFGVVMQLVPVVAGSNIRWHTSTETPGKTAIANTKSHVWVKIDPKPANRGVFLAFIIGLFTISVSGVALMWRHIGKPAEPERPGWERWRH